MPAFLVRLANLVGGGKPVTYVERGTGGISLSGRLGAHGTARPASETVDERFERLDAR